MKKGKFYAILAAVFAFVASCVSPDGALDEVPEGKMRIKATTESASVKTTLGSDYSVLWSSGDAIALFGISASQGVANAGLFELVDGAGTTSGIFEGELNDFESYYALYPENIYAGTLYYGGVADIVLPTNVIFAERNFVDRANPMSATGTAKDGLEFRNLMGIAELQIKGEGTITSMTIESSLHLAGDFRVDMANATLTPREGAVQHLSVTFDKDIELSKSEARSIYALLPPGTHENLIITTTDSDGNVTTRTATSDVVIERSKIHAVSEFSHEVIAVPYVSMRYLPEKSNFYAVAAHIAKNDLAPRVYYNIFTKAAYEEYISDSKSDAELALQAGRYVENSGAIGVACYELQGQEAVLLAVCADETGSPLSDVAKVELTVPVIPFTDDYNVLPVGEPRVTATGFEIDLQTSLSEGYYTYALYEAGNVANISQNVINTATLVNNITHFSGNNITISTADTYNLKPGGEYCIFYTVSRGELDGALYELFTDYARIGTQTIKLSDVTIADLELSVMFATSSLYSTVTVRSSNADHLKYYLSTYPYEVGSDINDYQVNNVGTVRPFQNGESEFDIAPLEPQTAYYLYILPYDAEGNYGVLQRYDFTTMTMGTPDDSYYDFLGTYSMEAINFLSKEPITPREVVITPAVEGCTYNVKGVIDSTKGVADDTFTAYYANQRIYFGHSLLPNSGMSPDVYVVPLNANGNLNTGAYISSTYGDGDMWLYGVAGDIGYDGLIFYQSTNGGYQGGSVDLIYEIRLVKKSDAAESYDKIGLLGDNVAANVKGIVTAVGSQAVILTDDTGSIVLYGTNHGYQVGDELVVSGTAAHYQGYQNNCKQFIIADSTIRCLSTGNAVSHNPTTISAADIDNYVGNRAEVKQDDVEVRGVLAVNGSHVNLTVAGATYQVSFKYVDNSLYSGYNGKEVIVRGYNVGTYNWYYILPYHVEEVATPVPPTGNANTTENFGRGNSVDAGWN